MKVGTIYTGNHSETGDLPEEVRKIIRGFRPNWKEDITQKENIIYNGEEYYSFQSLNIKLDIGYIINLLKE